MSRAKLFSNGGSQAVRLPKEYRFEGTEVYAQKRGEIVYLLPIDKRWDVFRAALEGFSDDFMVEGRMQGAQAERDTL